jgi:hypothetical protein
VSNPWDEVESFIRERREKETAERTANESRELFDGLSAKVDSIAESLKTFLDRSTSEVPPADGGADAPPADGSAAGGGADSPPPPEPHGAGGGGDATDELPVEHVRKIDIPRIYTGDDEPAEVQYVDPDSGETRTRKGRRKGRVATYTVEPYEPPAPDDAEEVA